MDNSVLSDRKAPWHDDPDTGYVGTHNYYSPEHLRAEAPVETSDVYTCSLILHDLLGASHPYESEEPDDYKNKAFSYGAPKPRLEGEIKDAATTDLVADYLHRCLHPDPTQRPTAKDLRDALNGKAPPLGEAFTSTPPVRPPERTPERPPEKPPEPTLSTLVLEGPAGGSLTLKIDTKIGKSAVTQFGEDSQFWSEPQFTLERTGVEWAVVYNPGAQNETLLNGKAVSGSQPVKDGDQLAVGREAKGIVKLPLKVKVS